MYSANLNIIDGGRGVRLSLTSAQKALSFSDVIQRWCLDESFQQFFIMQLCDIPFKAYFWELPALFCNMLDRPFECVFIDSLDLVDVHSDADSFSAYFSDDQDIVDFSNLNGDAWLIAPCPQGAAIAAYPHLAVFSRQAPVAQQQALWQRVGRLLGERLNHKPLWLSTSGLGVYWLHIRLDSAPKYYSYHPYRNVLV